MNRHSFYSRLFLVTCMSFATVGAFNANASTVSFNPGLSILNGGGYKYVEVDGFRFETPSYGRLVINTYTGEGRHNGGLWDGNAFGVATPIKITRIDGQAFSLQGFSILDHAGFACYQSFCGLDSVGIQGYEPGSSTTFGVSYQLDGYNNTYDFFSPAVQDARFGNLREALISTGDSFILDSINLTAVPLPSAAWLFGTGLLGFFYRNKKRA